MKIESTPREPDTRYSTGMEAGDFVPYFHIEHGNRKLDIQVKAGAPLLLVFLHAALGAEEIKRCLALKTSYPVYFITAQDSGVADERVFCDPQVYRLFMPGEQRFGVFLCSRNLKILTVAIGDDYTAALAAASVDTSVTATRIPPPVLLVPDVILPAQAQRLIHYFEEHEADAFRNSGTYKSRSHLHPSKALELELDNKLCKSLLPEIGKVFYSQISHRETYKICCYDASEKGAFGKHRDTIDPHLHRRYALTLVLNDDYEGGGIRFPEYSDDIVPVPKYAAVIFPGSLYHQVREIGRGRRYVLVSFLFTEAEARVKADCERYRFLVKRDVCDLRINRLLPLGAGEGDTTE
jgi:predicted 2-oxoglutarate/Fe(II)-dependent dioxygenase YbiX